MLCRRKKTLFLLVFLSVFGFFLYGCGSDSSVSGSSGPPEVTSTYPEDNEEDVSVTTSVRVIFNQPMEESSINDSTFTLQQGADTVTGTISTTDTSATMNFSDSNRLAYGAEYRVSLSTEITDAKDETLSNEYQWNFFTEEQEGERQDEPEPSFRVRSNFEAGLNADEGWAGDLNEHVTVDTDQPFRVRFELEADSMENDQQRLRLQYRRNDGDWMNVEASDFPYPESASLRTSIVSTDAFDHGAETTDLLDGSGTPFSAGAGIDLAEASPSWTGGSGHSEWEWPLVIRRFADGPVTNEEGDSFDFRMTDENDTPLTSNNPRVTVSVPPGHVGGTFVETPGRVGPWEASNGDLYFIMEPTVTDYLLMVVKSTDGGATWQVVDNANRPSTRDLEGFATVRQGDTIHMLHQTSHDVWYHSFRMSDHSTAPDTWDVGDEKVAEPEEPPTQVASIAARSDGSLVGVYGGPDKIHFKVRSPDGTWGSETVVDAGQSRDLSGPQVVSGEDDIVHLAYTGDDGTAWYRRIQPEGTLTPREQLADGLGTTEYDVGSILPLVYISETNTVAVIYRLATGRLWERRIVDHGSPGDPTRVSDRDVVQNPVDSDQAGADAVADGTAVHVLFIEEGTGGIYHTRSDEEGTWQSSSLEVDGVNAQWIRGMRLSQGRETSVYGFIYDAGSGGGSGMNRYDEVPLNGR